MNSHNEQFHPIQRKILFDLLFEKALRFADLKPFEMENSQFIFHINQLIEKGLVRKYGSKYNLTDQGKEVANKVDIFTMSMGLYPKTTTVMCVVRENKNKKEFLIYKRLKNPFYGCYGFPTQKVLYGESVESAVVKGLYEETGLKGTPKLFAIRHYRVYNPKEELMEDKIMYAYLFLNPIGELVPHIEGEYFWVPQDEIKKQVVKPQEEFFEIYEALISKESPIFFKELTVTTSNF